MALPPIRFDRPTGGCRQALPRFCAREHDRQRILASPERECRAPHAMRD
jgi:hypothetical protein